jgi:hypothetical protein
LRGVFDIAFRKFKAGMSFEGFKTPEFQQRTVEIAQVVNAGDGIAPAKKELRYSRRDESSRAAYEVRSPVA